MTKPTCILHKYSLVNNHYNDKGEPDAKSFSEGEWRTEKICMQCGKKFEDNKFLLKLNK